MNVRELEAARTAAVAKRRQAALDALKLEAARIAGAASISDGELFALSETIERAGTSWSGFHAMLARHLQVQSLRDQIGHLGDEQTLQDQHRAASVALDALEGEARRLPAWNGSASDNARHNQATRELAQKRADAMRRRSEAEVGLRLLRTRREELAAITKGTV
jgi:hypothetical protein